MTASDEQLMLAVAEGDLDAFDEIVRRYRRTARNVAHRFLGDPAEAADIAQEAFLKILTAALGATFGATPERKIDRVSKDRQSPSARVPIALVSCSREVAAITGFFGARVEM